MAEVARVQTKVATQSAYEIKNSRSKTAASDFADILAQKNQQAIKRDKSSAPDQAQSVKKDDQTSKDVSQEPVQDEQPEETLEVDEVIAAIIGDVVPKIAMGNLSDIAEGNGGLAQKGNGVPLASVMAGNNLGSTMNGVQTGDSEGVLVGQVVDGVHNGQAALAEQSIIGQKQGKPVEVSGDTGQKGLAKGVVVGGDATAKEPAMVGKNPLLQGENLAKEGSGNPIVDTKTMGTIEDPKAGVMVEETIQPMIGGTGGKADGQPVTVVPINDSSSLLQKHVHEQVQEKIMMNLEQGKTEFSMTLMPERLGKIDVKMIFEAGRLMVRVEAQNPMTQQLLASNISELKNTLQANQIPVADVYIGQNLSESYSGEDGRKQEWHQQQENKGNNSNANASVDEEMMAEPAQIMAEERLNYTI